LVFLTNKYYITYNKLNGKIISDLLNYASDKEKIAEILGQANINKLTDDNVYNLLSRADDKDQMAIILGSKNINKLTNNNVWKLIAGTDGNRRYYRQEMINFIIKYKTELSDADVYTLLASADDKNKIAKMLGSDNINKLTGDYVVTLIGVASDKVEMAEILGSDNINKITGNSLSILLKLASDRYEMEQLLKSYYTGTNQEVISLLNQ
jgi:hypothetical protein